MRAEEPGGAAIGAPYRGTAKNQRWWLSTAISGSLALHVCAFAASAFVFDGAMRESEASPLVTVYLLPAPAGRPPLLPANLVPPPPSELPVPVFRETELRLPPPADLPPPPDFRSPRAAPAPSTAHSVPRTPTPRPSMARATVHEPSLSVRAAPSPPPSSSAAAPPATAGAIVAPGWDDRMSDWLAAHRIYPAIALSRREQGDVTVRFTVAGNGRVKDVSVLAGSGHSALDKAALAMLRGADVPAPGSEVSRTVAIRYHLAD